MRWVVLVLMTLHLAGVEAGAYQAWSQGRPADAAGQLLHAAQESGDWQTWFDFGLAAAAAERQPEAVAGLVRAHVAAPMAAEPIKALRALQVPLPATWQERLGVLVLPGSGWWGVVACFIAGLALGVGILVPARRWAGLGVGVVVVVLVAPGVAAPWLAAGDDLLVVLHDGHLLDGTGAPVGTAVPAGSLVIRQAGEPWAGRILVREPLSGQRGWLAAEDHEIAW